MPPAGIGETEVDLIGHGGVEGGGDALKAGELGIIRRGGGAGERDGGDELGGVRTGAAEGGNDAAFGGGASRMVVVWVAAMRLRSSPPEPVSRCTVAEADCRADVEPR